MPSKQLTVWNVYLSLQGYNLAIVLVFSFDSPMHWDRMFNLVFLEISIVGFGTVFANAVTIMDHFIATQSQRGDNKNFLEPGFRFLNCKTDLVLRHVHFALSK